MHDATSNPAPVGSSGAISPESILQKLLAFIGAAQSDRDFERNRFWAAMQLPPRESNDQQYFEEEEGYQAFTQEVGDTRWSYTISLNEGSTESGTPHVRLAFAPPTGGAPDFSPVCRLDFESFRTALIAKGFAEGPPDLGKAAAESPGSKKVWLTRGDISVDILAQQGSGKTTSGQKVLCILVVEARSLAKSDGASH